MQWFLFFLLIAIVYTYVGYSLLLLFLLKFFRNEPKKGKFLNAVSVIISVFNGEDKVESRIKNVLEQKNIHGTYEVIVISDGSTDDTVKRALLVQDPRVRVFDFKQNRGKAAVLNEVIPLCRGEVVALTDVRQEFDSCAISKLCENFCDPEISAVSGELLFTNKKESDSTHAQKGLGAYWEYEKWLRKMESAIDSTCGCTGAIYAIRKLNFVHIKPNIVLDDVAIPMLMIKNGQRVIFDARAKAYDSVSDNYLVEKERKIRTLAGVYQLLWEYPEFMMPWRNRIWLQFFSHKVMRLFCPYWLLGLLVTSAVLASEEVFIAKILFFGQILFYLMVVLGCLFPQKIFSLPKTFFFLNWTAVLALIQFFKGVRPNWVPTQSKVLCQKSSNQ